MTPVDIAVIGLLLIALVVSIVDIIDKANRDTVEREQPISRLH